MDKFPEAFERFEEQVDIDQIEGMTELKLVFVEWMGKGWKNTAKQNAALRIEAERYGIAKPRKREQKPIEKPTRIPKKVLPRMPPDYFMPERQPEKLAYVAVKTRYTVKYYVVRGYSANQVQKQMQSQGIGIRRTVLLRQVRELKRQPQREHREKYVPRKYRK
jgi:hypothetical protein